MAAREDISLRTIIVYIGVMLCAAGIVAQAVAVMTVKRGKWLEMASANVPVRPVDIAPNRGDIWAADGRILATSVPFYELHFDPVAVNAEVFREKVDSLAYCLSAFFKDASKASYKEKLQRARRNNDRYLLINRLQRARRNNDRYLLINRRRVNHTELKKIRTFPIFRLGKNRGGFIAEVYDKRLQPHQNLASRTIGYLNSSEEGGREGRVGLEAAFENELKGEEGKGMRRMMSGTWMTVAEQEPENGHDRFGRVRRV